MDGEREQVTAATGIVWTGPEQCDATVDGTLWSGITPASRFWQNVLVATDGRVPAWTPPPEVITPPAPSIEERLAALEGRLATVEAEVETVRGERQEPVVDPGIGGGDIGIGGGKGGSGGDEEPITPAFAPIVPAMGGMAGGLGLAGTSDGAGLEPGAVEPEPSVKTFRATASKIHTNKCRFGTSGETVERAAAQAMVEAGTHTVCANCNPKVNG